MKTTIADLLSSRYSARGFKPDPVPQALLNDIFAESLKAASNCNTQPWQVYVVSGEMKDKVSNAMLAEVMSGKGPSPEFAWNVRYQGVHKDRQWGSAMALYGAMGIEREDKPARMQAMGRNWQFFGAPHGAFFAMEKYLDIMGAVDVGIYAQTLSLLLEENGIQSCMQGALGQFPAPVKNLLGIPDEQGILFGMSFGYADDHDANDCRTDRVALEDGVKFFS
ncbi:nitroreductase [Algimonas porphyrae]|nr:nitroreductase [Algimonas porphyrae]